MTTVTDYFWRVGAQWKLIAYAGSGPATAAAKGEQIDIMGRAGEVEVKRVDNEDPPYVKLNIYIIFSVAKYVH